MTSTTSTPAHAPSDETNPAPPRHVRWAVRLLQVIAAIATALVVVQAALAGHALTGQATARHLHGLVGTEVFLSVAGVQVIAAGTWRIVGGSTRAVVLALTLFGLITVQSTLGWDGRLALHVPNGMVILMGQLGLLWTART